MSSDAKVERGGAGRLTPYELVFGPGGFETRAFPRILAEIELRGADVSAPERFLRLESVTALLRELAGDAPGVDVYGRYGALLYHAWHFWRFDRRVFAVEETLARRLVESTSTVGTWQLTPPHPAGYMQLPRHLFWARVEEGATPEPVDGFFWTMPGRDDPETPPFDRLDALLVLGMRPGRPGFGSIPVGVELSGAPPGHWADADGRAGGDDFANLLPGGELHGWYGLVTELEVLKLVSRIFRYVVVNPDALGEPVEPVGAGEAGALSRTETMGAEASRAETPRAETSGTDTIGSAPADSAGGKPGARQEEAPVPMEAPARGLGRIPAFPSSALPYRPVRWVGHG